MKWFGEPWPRANFRAGVCADDNDRVETPIGILCARCTWQIKPDDRGVEIPVLGTANVNAVAVYHIHCFLAEVVGERMAAEIRAKGGLG